MKAAPKAAPSSKEASAPPIAKRDPVARAFLFVTLALVGLRIAAMRAVGFGDSEALYACYALHPQPAYLDHPGLVGTVAGLIAGDAGAPTPERAHAVTTVIATLVPWMVFVVARVAGAAVRPAMLAALAVAAAPVIAVGLFALTPDLVLAPLWLASLGFAISAVQGKPGELRTSTMWLAAGLFAGACGAAKVSGLLLPLAFVAALATPTLRAHARSMWPWAGLAVGAVVMAPIVSFEAQHGWPMLRHRLVDTQSGAGLSLRTIGALFGGQFLYVSPLLLVLVVLAARSVAKRRWEDPIDAMLFFAFAVPTVALVPLMLWSRVAEPHWLAPAFLALPIAAARTPFAMPKWLLPSAIVLGLVMTFVVHVWVLVPDSFKFARPQDPKLDISNELFGWDEAERSIKEILSTQSQGSDVVIVGPHWTVCAQVHARLGAGVPVGCMTPIRDDFDDWYPRAQWNRAEKILFVSDNRFPEDPAKLLPNRNVARRGRASVFRGGRLARTFTFTLFEGMAHADAR